MKNRHHFALGIIGALGLAAFAQGCLDRPVEAIEPRSTSTLTLDLGEDRIDKIDILLTIDDSGSMSDKQVILSEAIPRLVESLVNPDCVTNDGQSSAAPVTPERSTDACPAGMHRRFAPVYDIHVGVISTSVPVKKRDGELAAQCDSDTQLLFGEVKTYAGRGFLAWDPNGLASPAGEDDNAAFRDDLVEMVTGVGQLGCGYEQPLESWYRFLIDPDTGSEAIAKDRAAFLRPDSLLAVVMLTDENDCSIDPSGDFDTAGFDGRSNISCFEQQDRLYPVERYIDGLTSPTIEDASGKQVPNPLFAGGERKTENVLLTGIVGVPWQRLARDPKNLTAGLMNATELRDKRVWDQILGDPDQGVAPQDAHMVESELPRDGLPRAGDALDPIHGHEHTVGDKGIGELQYACTFELPESFHVTCTTQGCDCTNPADKSVCDGNVQRRAKAYPGLRQLAVLRGIDEQGVVASICASQLDDDRAADYGYQPAIGALVDRLADKLGTPCLSRKLTPNDEGQVACVVIEGRRAAGTCACDGAARQPVSPQHQGAVVEALGEDGVAEDGIDCFCEIEQLRDAELDACQTAPASDVSLDGQPVNGWCYTDHTAGEAETCEQKIRLMGDAEPEVGARVFITCVDER